MYSCNIKIPYARALEIQAGHLNHYGKTLSFEHEQELRNRIAAATIKAPFKYVDKAGTGTYTEADLIPIHVINQIVPRGGTIEAEAKQIREGK